MRSPAWPPPRCRGDEETIDFLKLVLELEELILEAPPGHRSPRAERLVHQTAQEDRPRRGGWHATALALTAGELMGKRRP